MTEVKQSTKLAQSIIQGFNYAKPCNHSGLYAIYSKPSETKKCIYEYWENKFFQIMREKGSDFTIQIKITGNCNTFSLYCLISDGLQGDLYYITKSYDRVIKGVTL